MNTPHRIPSLADAQPLELSPELDVSSGAPPPIVQGSKSCVGCGYSLEGLPFDGRCPECGFPVARSLVGFRLEYASPEYLRSLQSGLRLILNGILAQIILAMVSFALAISVSVNASGAPLPAWFQLATNGADLALSFVMVLGYWRFTRPDMGYRGTENTAAPRRVVRAASCTRAGSEVVGFVFGLGAAMMGYAIVGRTVPLILGVTVLLGLVGLVAWAALFFGMMRYVRWLSGRVPDPAIGSKTDTYMWLLPVLTIVGAFVLVGPLIALVLYWNLLDKMLGHVKRALNQAETNLVAA